MSGWIRGALERATTTQSDEREAPQRDGRVVDLHDPDAPPPALQTTWRSIIAHQKRIAELTAQREQAEQTVSKLTRAIGEEEGRMIEDQGRWLMMTRALGIDIKEGDGE